MGNRWDIIPGNRWLRARELRRCSTLAEKKLWAALRNNDLGVKFRRQQPIGPYIVDFYAAKPQLVIEIDGTVHKQPDVFEHDAERESFLKSQGLLVKHFSNSQVVHELDSVLTEIRAAVQKRRDAI